ncbi:MAG: pilus assembly protein [Anaerolineales bacterium]|nr:pilus assembly protein [Anaerolineales bacterium]
MRKLLHKEGSESGQSMIEFALSLVMLLILLAALVDGSRVLFTYLALRDAAQEGAIFAAIAPCQENLVEQHVLGSSALVNGLGLDPATDINVCISGGSACTGTTIQVEVIYDNFELTMPLLGGTIFTIRATVRDTIVTPKCSDACSPAPGPCT